MAKAATSHQDLTARGSLVLLGPDCLPSSQSSAEHQPAPEKLPDASTSPSHPTPSPGTLWT